MKHLKHRYEQEAGDGSNLSGGDGAGAGAGDGAGGDGAGDISPEVQAQIDAAVAKITAKNTQLLGLNKKMGSKLDEMDASNQQLMEKMKDEEERRMIENGDIDSVVSLRSAKQIGVKDDRIRELEIQHSSAMSQIDALRINDIARDAAINSGVMPQATEEVRLLVGSYYKMEDGKPVGYKNGEEMLNEKGENLTMQEFIQSLAAVKPYLFSKTQGAGANGAGRQGGMAGAKRSEMSMEQKSEYVSQHGEAAYLQLPY